MERDEVEQVGKGQCGTFEAIQSTLDKCLHGSETKQFLSEEG